MFERFTDRARAVVVTAQEQARARNHNYIGTAHLLLALSLNEGMSSRILEDLGVEPATVEVRVSERVPDGQFRPTGHIPFSLNAKKTMEMSLRMALEMGHNYIGTEHQLLGLIRAGGTGADLLAAEGVERDAVKAAAVALNEDIAELKAARGDTHHYEVESEPEVVRRVRPVDGTGRRGEWSTNPADWPASVRDGAGRIRRRVVGL